MVSVPAFAVVVEFPDPGLEAAIRGAIGKTTGDIFDSDLIGLMFLDAVVRRIVNLEGIQHCVDLTEIHLSDNEIVDITALSGLTNLTVLALSDNEIVDISPLSGLPNLEQLYLYDNEIVDISALSGLTNLTLLGLWENEVVDINALSGLTNLEWLDMGDNEIVDISALSDLPNLAELWLHRNQIVDIAPLVNNPGIDSDDKVGLSYNQLLLQPGSPNMLDIEALRRRGVNVSTAVVSFPDAGLEAAIRSSIWKPTGEIHDTELIGLAFLDARGLGIVNLEGIQHCVDLTMLILIGNQIVDISELASLGNLMGLDLTENEIVDISPLSGLANLTTLWLDENEIVDISSLSGLPNLAELDLHNNQISDIAPLVNNTGIDTDDDVGLSYNQLLLQPGSPDMLDIEALQERGVRVDFDPQN